MQHKSLNQITERSLFNAEEAKQKANKLSNKTKTKPKKKQKNTQSKFFS